MTHSLNELAMTYILRKLQNSDIMSVSEIEREAFPSLWPRSAFKSEMDNPKIKHLVAALLPPENAVEEDAQVPVSGPMAQRLIRNLREVLRPLLGGTVHARLPCGIRLHLVGLGRSPRYGYSR